MDREPRQFKLPGQFEKVLAAASLYLAKQGNTTLRQVIVNSSYRIQEEFDYDNWNGGQWGHAVYFTVPAQLYFDIIDDANETSQELTKTLNRLCEVNDEYVATVFFELQDDASLQNWRENSGVLLHKNPAAVLASTAELHRIWTPGMMRLFMSHKASYKAETAALKRELVRFGVTSFVAHDDIEPTREWQDEIERALFSMDALAVIMTEDFHDSNWTDQEVGVAIGRTVPIVPIQLGMNPYGFIGKYQAMNGYGKKSHVLAHELFELLWAKQSLRPALTEGLIQQFVSASSFTRANQLMRILERIEIATPEQIERIEKASVEKVDLRRAWDVRERLPDLLQRLKGHQVG